MSRLSRRALLGGAGALAALPLLESLKADEQPYPTRLVLVYNPNGTIVDELWPRNVTSESQFELNTIHRPLAAFQDRLLLLKGVDLAVTTTGPGGPHQRGVGALFTGRELQAGDFVGGDGSLAGWANGQSIDQRVVDHQGIVTALPSLELGVRATTAEVRSRISYKAAANPLPPTNDPNQVYSRLFPALPSDDPTMARRKRVLASVQSQFARLSSRVGSEDRVKLSAHAELVADVERRLDLTPPIGLDCGAGYTPHVANVDDENAMPDISQLQLDVLAMALSCDVTRVASVQFSNAINDIRFPWLNSAGSGHTLSHAGDSDTSARNELIARSTWYSEQVAYLMARLDQIPEGNGSVLDHTLIVWGNELSVGNSHSLQSIPFVLAGGASGRLRMGRTLEFDHAPHNNLLVSILNAMGVPDQTFGNPDFCTGPLSGLV